MMSQPLLLDLAHFIIELFGKVRLASVAEPCSVQVAWLCMVSIVFVVCRGAWEWLSWSMSLAI